MQINPPLGNLPLRLRVGLLTAAALASVALVFAKRLPQPRDYHRFADTRTYLDIPNFFNVASNFGFAVVGAGVLAWIFMRRATLSKTFIERGELWVCVALYASTFLVTFGSAYYHLAPDNERLFWDRLPMALVASAFVGSVFADRFGARAGTWALAALLPVLLGALIYWQSTFAPGPDNVWPYFVTLYGSLGFALIVMALFPSRYTHARAAWVTLAIYAVAMAFDDWLDTPLYLASGALSGHSLKHMLAAVALFWLAWGSFRVREAKLAV